MSKLMILADKINKYLRAKNLEKMSGTPEDLLSLYEMSLRSVWKIEDKEIREAYAVEIGHFLKPYFGGRNVAEALESLTDKLDKDFSEAKEHAEIQEIKDKMSEPGYVPTFDELMKSQDE